MITIVPFIIYDHFYFSVLLIMNLIYILLILILFSLLLLNTKFCDCLYFIDHALAIKKKVKKKQQFILLILLHLVDI
jgi:hypothetical protein